MPINFKNDDDDDDERYRKSLKSNNSLCLNSISHSKKCLFVEEEKNINQKNNKNKICVWIRNKSKVATDKK